MNSRVIPLADSACEGAPYDRADWIGWGRPRLVFPESEQRDEPKAGEAGPDLLETYGWLAGRSQGRPTNRFDLHALASVFAQVLVETDWGRTAPLTRALGLGFDEAIALVVTYFPHAVMEIGAVLGDTPIERSEAENSLLELLSRGMVDPREIGARLARILARRAQGRDPLWQALGLRNRGELSTLMSRHFSDLARRNSRDVWWKEFFSRNMRRNPGQALCTAPGCLDCEDFFRCFGEGAEEREATASASSVGAHAVIV